MTGDPVKMLVDVAKANKFVVDDNTAAALIKSKNGDYSSALNSMLDAHGGSYDDAELNKIHEQYGLKPINAEFLMNHLLSDKQEETLQDERANLFTKAYGDGSTEVNYPTRSQDINRIHLIKNQLEENDKYKAMLPAFKKIDRDPLKGKGVEELVLDVEKKREEAKKTRDAFSSDPLAIPAESGVSIEGLDASVKAADDDYNKLISSFAQDRLSPYKVISGKTALFNAKHTAEDGQDLYHTTDNILKENIGRIERQIYFAQHDLANNPNDEEAKQRFDLGQQALKLQQREYAKTMGPELSLELISEGNRASNERYSKSVGVMNDQRIIARGFMNVVETLKNTVSNMSHASDGGIETAGQYSKRRKRQEAALIATSNEGNVNVGNPVKDYVDVKGQRFEVDDNGNIIGAVDKYMNPLPQNNDKTIQDKIDADIQSKMEEYNKNKSQYPSHISFSFGRLIGTGAEVAAQMVPMILAGAAVGAVSEGTAVPAVVNAAMSFGQMYYPAFQSFLKAGKSYKDATALAFGQTAIDSIVENLGGFELRTGAKIADAAKIAFKNNAAKIIEEYAKKGSYKSMLAELTMGAMEVLPKELRSEFLEEMTQNINDGAWLSIAQNKDYNLPSWQETVNTALALAPSVMTLGAVGHIAKTSAQRETYKKGYIASLLQPDAAHELIDQAVKDGHITQKEADIKKQSISDSAEFADQLDKDSELSDSQKNAIADLLVRRDAARSMERNSAIDAKKQKFADEANKLTDELNAKYEEFLHTGKKDINEPDVDMQYTSEDAASAADPTAETKDQSAPIPQDPLTQAEPISAVDESQKSNENNGQNTATTQPDGHEPVQHETAPTDGEGQSGDNTESKTGDKQSPVQEAVPSGEPVSVLDKTDEPKVEATAEVDGRLYKKINGKWTHKGMPVRESEKVKQLERTTLPDVTTEHKGVTYKRHQGDWYNANDYKRVHSPLKIDALEQSLRSGNKNESKAEPKPEASKPERKKPEATAILGTKGYDKVDGKWVDDKGREVNKEKAAALDKRTLPVASVEYKGEKYVRHAGDWYNEKTEKRVSNPLTLRGLESEHSNPSPKPVPRPQNASPQQNSKPIFNDRQGSGATNGGKPKNNESSQKPAGPTSVNTRTSTSAPAPERTNTGSGTVGAGNTNASASEVGKTVAPTPVRAKNVQEEHKITRVEQPDYVPPSMPRSQKNEGPRETVLYNGNQYDVVKKHKDGSVDLSHRQEGTNGSPGILTFITGATKEDPEWGSEVQLQGDRSGKFKQVDLKQVNDLLAKLGKAIKGVFGGILSEEKFNDKIQKGQSFKDNNGTVYGAFVDGKVYLNEAALNANTPIHEYGHIFLKILARVNPSAYQRGLKLADQSHDLLFLLRNAKGSFYEKEAEEYKKGNKEPLLNEVLARAIGDRGEKMANKTGFSAWIRDFWEKIKRIFGGKLTDMGVNALSKLTLDQFASLAAGHLLSGEAVSESFNNRNIQEEIEQYLNSTPEERQNADPVLQAEVKDKEDRIKRAEENMKAAGNAFAKASTPQQKFDNAKTFVSAVARHLIESNIRLTYDNVAKVFTDMSKIGDTVNINPKDLRAFAAKAMRIVSIYKNDSVPVSDAIRESALNLSVENVIQTMNDIFNTSDDPQKQAEALKYIDELVDLNAQNDRATAKNATKKNIAGKLTDAVRNFRAALTDIRRYEQTGRFADYEPEISNSVDLAINVERSVMLARDYLGEWLDKWLKFGYSQEAFFQTVADEMEANSHDLNMRILASSAIELIKQLADARDPNETQQSHFDALSKIISKTQAGRNGSLIGASLRSGAHELDPVKIMLAGIAEGSITAIQELKDSFESTELSDEDMDPDNRESVVANGLKIEEAPERKPTIVSEGVIKRGKKKAAEFKKSGRGENTAEIKEQIKKCK